MMKKIQIVWGSTQEVLLPPQTPSFSFLLRNNHFYYSLGWLCFFLFKLKKSLLNLLQYCLFYVWVFWPRATWDFNSLNRDQIHIPCIGRQSLNHWTTREVPPGWLSVQYKLWKNFFYWRLTPVLNIYLITHLYHALCKKIKLRQHQSLLN